MEYETGDARRWNIAIEEFLLCTMLLPLIHMDFRLEASSVVSCSDASERGGGVVIATSLSRTGEEALLARLASVPNLFRETFGLVESCAGIGGARQACDLLGVMPCFYVVNEVLEEAINTLKHAWPSVHVCGGIEECTEETLRPIASGAPNVELVLHFGGTPCPGLCRWNPFAEGEQMAESIRMLAEFRRLTNVLKRVFPTAIVHSCNENVASMATGHCIGINRNAGCKAFCLDAQDLVEVRRRRYYWPSFNISPRAQVRIEDRGHFDHVTLLPA